jgi:hypothetical protein
VISGLDNFPFNYLSLCPVYLELEIIKLGVEVSKGTERTILPGSLFFQKAVEDPLSDALRITRVAVLY